MQKSRQILIIVSIMSKGLMIKYKLKKNPLPKLKFKNAIK